MWLENDHVSGAVWIFRLVTWPSRFASGAKWNFSNYIWIELVANCAKGFDLIEINYRYFSEFVGKARRLKQAKDEATEEIERYRAERDKQFKDFEAKVILVIFHQKTHIFHTNS